METDDDMFVVIIGDADSGESSIPAPIMIKEEVLDEDEILIKGENSKPIAVEELLKKAELHGERIEINLESIPKTEPMEYEELNNSEDDMDDDYNPVEDEDDEEFNDDSEEEDGFRVRRVMVKPAQCKSFVKELKEQYPELQVDGDLLVGTLAEIMRNTKPPPPPLDYYIMNGIDFECVKCGFMAESVSAAARHYQDKHGPRYLICYACGVDFRSTTNLYKHEKRCLAPDAVTVLKARALVVGRKGRSRPYLPKHLPSIPPQRKFPCQQCSAVFLSKASLLSHEHMHRGTRPFLCPVCPSAYTSNSALTRHIKKHSDVEYICDHCQRSFKVKTSLVLHMDTHRPVKPHGCTQCGRRYAQKAALNRHVNTRHRLLPPPCACQICPKRYRLMSLLKDHMKKAHGMILMTRRMFYKSLPTLSTTQIQKAKVVTKADVENELYEVTHKVEEVKPISEDVIAVNELHNIQEGVVENGVEEAENDVQVFGEDALSAEVLQYVAAMQHEDNSNVKVVVIENGAVVSVSENVSNELLSDPNCHQFIIQQDGQDDYTDKVK